MADNTPRISSSGRDIVQAITALKKGSYLLKYGRWGKPKFCPFRLSNDEKFLIWYAGKVEKQLKLSHVSKILPGQQTAIFHRYPQPEKEYQSFSLIYSNRSLDVICKDKVEAEVWIVALRALISQGSCCKPIGDPQSNASSPGSQGRKNSLSNVSCTSSDIIYKDSEDTHTVLVPCETSSQNRLGKAFSEVLSFTAAAKAYTQAESVSRSRSNLSSLDDSNSHSSAVDAFQNSSSSAVSSSGYGSSHEDVDGPDDVLFWGEGISNGLLGGNMHDVKSPPMMRKDALLPKALDTIAALDAQIIACGSKHAVIITKQGQIFSWGESSGGKLGHGVDADVSRPKVIDALSESTIVLVACGEFHTCAVTLSGNLFTWGDDTHNTGVLGHCSAGSCWIPREVIGQIESVRISFVSCGPWHTAAVSSQGKLFTFGDGTFGALGHGDRCSTSKPREVESLKDLRTLKVSCGIWHTAALVDFTNESDRSGSFHSGKLFTWGDGSKGQLGHGDEEPRLVPSCVPIPDGTSVCQVACAHTMTVALTVLGQVYTMGSEDDGQFGSHCSVGKLPIHTEGDIRNCHIEQIACGSHHIVALSSNGEVYTWGRGTNGQLGHGDIEYRHTPTLVKALKHKQVKSVVCGSNITAVICPHKCVSSADQSRCSGCHNPFNFRRKRHNCYNCGLLFCNACSTKRSLKAALAPDVNKPSRVCDECFTKLKTAMDYGPKLKVSKSCRGSIRHNCKEITETESLTFNPPHQLCRLSSLDSFKHALGQNSQQNKKAESCTDHISPTQIGSFHWEPTYEYEDLKEMSASVPGSQMLSQASSPVSGIPSPARSRRSASSSNIFANAEFLLDNSKQRNKSLSQEILLLRRQVGDLTHKSHILEADIDRISRKLKEAIETVRKESEKNKVAKEVIKSLTAQFKNMAKSIPEQWIASTNPDSLVEMTSNFLSRASSEKHLTSATYLEYEYNGKLIIPNVKKRSEKRSELLERILKDKPRMYVMRPPLPQVQFS